MNSPRLIHRFLVGLMLASLTACATHSGKKSGHAEAPKTGGLTANGKLTNRSSSLPEKLPAGAHVSYSRVPTTEKVLAMTFDDGPNPTLTPRLLDLLKERNIKATFFVVGSNARAYPHIIRRILAEGHEIGNHSYTHTSLTSCSDEKIRKEMKDTDDAVLAAADYHQHLMRPPYGATNARIKDMLASAFGYTTILWSVDPLDWKRPGVSVVTSRLVNGAHPGAIMLAHDIHASTIAAMPEVFDQLLAKGYQFVTVSQLINLEKAQPTVARNDPTPLPQ